MGVRPRACVARFKLRRPLIFTEDEMEEKDPKPAEDVAGDTGSDRRRDGDAGASENLPSEESAVGRSREVDENNLVEAEGPVKEEDGEDIW